jgi:hypothetical protein
MKTQRERVIAEADRDGWLVMWPDGTVERFRSQRAVLKAVGQRIGKADILVTEVEWRSA